MPRRKKALIVKMKMTIMMISEVTMIMTTHQLGLPIPYQNKLVKARKTRTSPNTLGLKKFGLGKLWVKKVCRVKNVFQVKKVFRVKNVFGQKSFWVKKVFGSKKNLGQKHPDPKLKKLIGVISLQLFT